MSAIADEIDRMAQEINRLRALNAELVAALEPFDQYDENRAYLINGFTEIKVRLGDLRRARAALEKARK